MLWPLSWLREWNFWRAFRDCVPEVQVQGWCLACLCGVLLGDTGTARTAGERLVSGCLLETCLGRWDCWDGAEVLVRTLPWLLGMLRWCWGACWVYVEVFEFCNQKIVYIFANRDMCAQNWAHGNHFYCLYPKTCQLWSIFVYFLEHESIYTQNLPEAASEPTRSCL